MSDSPPPFNDDDSTSTSPHNSSGGGGGSKRAQNESEDLFFSTIGESSESHKQNEDMDELFKIHSPNKDISGSLDATNEIRLDDDDDSNLKKSSSFDKPFSLASNSSGKQLPSAASINIQPTLSNSSLNENPFGASASAAVVAASQSSSLKRNNTVDVDEEEEDKDKFIEVNVTEPHKVGDGMSSYMTYRVMTKTNYPSFKSQDFAVNRRFSDFLALFEKLKEKHLQYGHFMPPAPEKDMIGTTKMKMSKEDTGPNEFIERRKASLERFLNRCGKHPRLKYDPDYRDFLETPDYSPKSSTASKFDMIRVFKNVGEAVNKISVKMPETDQWFEEKTIEVENLYLNFKRLHSSVESLCGWRKDHSVATKEFAKSAAVLAHSEEHINLAKALSQLGDVYEKIEQLVSDQAHSDFYMFCELLKDYIGLLDLIKETFYQRVKLYHNWQKAEETLKSKQEHKAKLEAASKQDKIPTVLAEIKDWEGRVDKSKDEFDKISKTIKQEMKRFDRARVNEFKKSLTKYLINLLDHQQAVLKVWEQYLPEVKAI